MTNPGKIKRQGRRDFIPGMHPDERNPYKKSRSRVFMAEDVAKMWQEGWDQASREHEIEEEERKDEEERKRQEAEEMIGVITPSEALTKVAEYLMIPPDDLIQAAIIIWLDQKSGSLNNYPYIGTLSNDFGLNFYEARSLVERIPGYVLDENFTIKKED